MSCAAVANVSLVLIAARLPAEASGGLTEAYAAIGEVLGQVAAVGFGLALLASGLSSTIVGIYTGQVVMQGFWRARSRCGCAGCWPSSRRWPS